MKGRPEISTIENRHAIKKEGQKLIPWKDNRE